MKYIIDTDDNSILGPIKDLTKQQDVKVKSLTEFHTQFAKSAKYETGLMAIDGSGLLSYRSAGGYEQIVFQHKPEIHNVKWGQYERDPKAKVYQLAQPYKILVSDYKDGVFLGTRHFFSPEAIIHWDQPLYATGFSNTNNVGYSGNSIGWTCLYHYAPVVSVDDLAGKIDYAVIRENGLGEPYNYGNMSSTDGPTFYQRYMPGKKHFHNAEEWHKKTKKEGLNWVFNPDNFIMYRIMPDKVMDPDWHAQATTFDKGSIPYTLRHATHGSYVAYYPNKGGGDTEYIRPFNREDGSVKVDMDGMIRTSLLTNSKDQKFSGGVNTSSAAMPAFSKAAKKNLDKFKYRKCSCCQNEYPLDAEFNKVIYNWDIGAIEDTTASIEYGEFCSTCIEDFACVINLHGIERTIYTELLTWVEDAGWQLPWDVNYCPICDWTTLKAIHPNISIEGVHNACIECYKHPEEHTWDVCAISNKNYPIENLIKTNILSWTGTSLESKSCYVFEVYKDLICRCGIRNNTVPWIAEEATVVDLDGFNVCSTCVDKPLIQNNVPVSVTVIDKEN